MTDIKSIASGIWRSATKALVVYSVLLTLVAVGATWLYCGVDRKMQAQQSMIQTFTRFLDKGAAQRADEEEIAKFVIQLMRTVEAKLPETKQNLVTQAIVRVSMEIFDSQDQRRQFATMIAIESKFKRDAKSSAGAVGYTQVLPQYSKEFGARCGLKDLESSDLFDTETNLLVGACQFRALLEATKGNIAMTLVAYNAGKNSMSLKQLETLATITASEPVNYVARFTYVHDKTQQDLDAKPKK